MSKKRKSRFGANVVEDAQRRKKEGSVFGHLNLPEGVHMFKDKDAVDRKNIVYLDVIPYIVQLEHHPDGDPDNPDSALPGNPWYKLPIMVHRNVGVDNDAVICPRTVGKKCPICEERDKELNSGVDWKDAIPKPQKRVLYVVIPIGAKKHDEDFYIYDKAHSLFQKMIDADLDEEPDRGRFPDVFEGLTLKVRFSEESFNSNDYLEASRIDYEEREDDTYDESIMDEAPCLDELITVLSYKEIYAKFFEMDPDDIDDDEGVPEPDPEPSTTSRRKRKTAEPELEPEEDNAPSARSRRRKTKPEEEESDPPRRSRRKAEEDNEDDPPAETEDPPARRRRKREQPKPEDTSKGKCPYGHKFGVDYDDHADCDDCNQEHQDTFDACGEANENE